MRKVGGWCRISEWGEGGGLGVSADCFLEIYLGGCGKGGNGKELKMSVEKLPPYN